MEDIELAVRDLVVANRILAHEDVVDAYGHVSIRHPANPERFFLSCSRSPELVQRSDIMEFELDGAVVGDDERQPYLERFIHGAIYEKRPDINSVVHSHAEDVLPFGIAPTPLRPRWDLASDGRWRASVRSFCGFCVTSRATLSPHWAYFRLEQWREKAIGGIDASLKNQARAGLGYCRQAILVIPICWSSISNKGATSPIGGIALGGRGLPQGLGSASGLSRHPGCPQAGAPPDAREQSALAPSLPPPSS